jgi:hypothetical protein
MSRAPRCLKCNTPLPFHSPLDGSDTKPYDGAVAICFSCGEVMIFDGKGFRFPTPEEFGEVMQDETFAAGLAAVAVKVAKAKDPVAVVITDKGAVTVIAPEAPAICEMCGWLEELRPYGPRKADGARMRVCLPCGMKDPVETDRAITEQFEGGR